MSHNHNVLKLSLYFPCVKRRLIFGFFFFVFWVEVDCAGRCMLTRWSKELKNLGRAGIFVFCLLLNPHYYSAWHTTSTPIMSVNTLSQTSYSLFVFSWFLHFYLKFFSEKKMDFLWITCKFGGKKVYKWLKIHGVFYDFILDTYTHAHTQKHNEGCLTRTMTASMSIITYHCSTKSHSL